MSKRAPKWQDLLGLDLELKLASVTASRGRTLPAPVIGCELSDSEVAQKSAQVQVVFGRKGTVH